MKLNCRLGGEKYNAHFGFPFTIGYTPLVLSINDWYYLCTRLDENSLILRLHHF